jgi:hypothetical protein
MRIISLLLFLLLFIGCRSAEDAFNDGRQAETNGNKLRAVQFYTETIRLDANHPTVHDRLQAISSSLMQKYQNSLQSKITEQNGQGALAYIQKSESLLRIVAPYNSNLQLPTNWQSLKSQANRLEIDRYFSESEASIKQGQWDNALVSLNRISSHQPSRQDRQRVIDLNSQINDLAFAQNIERATQAQKQQKTKEALSHLERARKYADSTQEKKEIDTKKESYRNAVVMSIATQIKDLLEQNKFTQAEQKAKELDLYQGQFGESQKDATRLLKAKVYSTWAESLAKQAKFRQAWLMNQEALKYDPKNPATLQALSKAEQQGRKSFTILPILFSQSSRELSHHIENDFKNTSLPKSLPFISFTSDFDLKDALRAFKIHPQTITREQAIRICQRTKASYAIFREITGYRLEKKFTGSRHEQVKRHDKTLTKMLIKKGSLTLKSSMRFTIIDANTGHRLVSEEISLDNTIVFEQAFPDEDPNRLLLTKKQAAYFDAPGSPRDIVTLEKKSTELAIGFFTDKILPAMEKLIP